MRCRLNIGDINFLSSQLPRRFLKEFTDVVRSTASGNQFQLLCITLLSFVVVFMIDIIHTIFITT